MKYYLVLLVGDYSTASSSSAALTSCKNSRHAQKTDAFMGGGCREPQGSLNVSEATCVAITEKRFDSILHAGMNGLWAKMRQHTGR